MIFAKRYLRLIVGIISFIIYGYGLYPGRIYKDSATIIDLLLQGRSTDQWSAIYFWFLRLTTINGRFPFVAALVCAALFYLAVYLLIDSLPFPDRNRRYIFLAIIVTPFVGVFGFTIGHDVTATTGIFLLLSNLFRSKRHKWTFQEIFLISLGLLLSSTSFLGCSAAVGYSMVVFCRKRKVLAALSIFSILFISLSSPDLFRIEKAKVDLILASFLGDLKCIAQNPNAEISISQWKTLSSWGPTANWLEAKSCTIADHSFFALEAASKSKYEVIKTWYDLSKANPQIMLQARIQRASNALPPIFFRSPPNMFDTSYSNPVGTLAAGDLQIAPDLFKTSTDIPNDQFNSLPFQKIIESMVLMPAFFFNQRSDLWGWGGFWLSFTLLVLLAQYRRKSSTHIANLLPLLFVHLLLIFFSPSPSPRYIFASIVVGLIFAINTSICAISWVRNSD